MKRLVLLTYLAACGAATHGEDTLTDSIRAFNDDIWWSKFETAAIFLPATERAQFVDDWDERAKDLKITEYDVVRVTRKTDAEARVQVKLEWYKSSEGTVHETHALQTWERRGKHWMLVDESRMRGSEMPGLPEPLQKDEPAPRKDEPAARKDEPAARKDEPAARTPGLDR